MRQRTWLVALLALAAIFAGCKGESPTGPSTTPPTTTGGPGGGVTPPTTASVQLTVSNATPLVDSDVVVTATVTSNGQPVPNGTAVEFSTTIGRFKESNAQTALRTTTNGVATITLTSSTAGAGTVTAVVANAQASQAVTYSLKPATPVPPDLAPQITNVTPLVGPPQGGQLVTIVGKNFTAPVRVLFDFGAANGGTKEAQVVSVNAAGTQIEVITPTVDLGTGQTAEATIVVITQAGSPNEQRATSTQTFRFESPTLTPVFQGLSPSSGPIDGGTMITIFGEGFQAPVQVFFGAAEAQVINVSADHKQMTVIAPTARDTNPNASGPLTGPVVLTIKNILSGTSVQVADAFRYIAKMQITAVGPTEGPFTGGTIVTIDGTGFNDPVAIVIGGVAATPLEVTATKIRARTNGVAISGCADEPGPTRVVNIDNGDFAEGPDFTFRVFRPFIVGVAEAASPANGLIEPGEPVIIRVSNPGPGPHRVAIGDRTLLPTGSTTNPDGTVSFTIVLPTNFTFTTEPCVNGSGIAGVRSVPLNLNVVFTALSTGCTDTLSNGITVTPLDTTCRIPPPPVASFNPAPGPGCEVALPSTTVAGPPATTSATFTVTNAAAAGSQSLTLTAPVRSGGPNSGDFTIAPNSASTVAPQQTVTYTVTFDPSVAAASGATFTFTTNDPARPTVAIDVCGTGNP